MFCISTLLFTLSVSISFLPLASNTPLEEPTLLQPAPPVLTHRWAHVQKTIEDGIVHVFNCQRKIDWLEPYKTPQSSASTGSGFFINEKGDILTNYHVIENAEALFIRIPSLGKKHFQVSIIGAAPEYDIALLSLGKDNYEEITTLLGAITPLPLGNSDAITRTEEVMALGFPLDALSLQSTLGNISGLANIENKTFIQITSPINPGNSGGPTVNQKGEVIGINARVWRGANNIGYSIPVSEIKHLLDSLYHIPLFKKPSIGGEFSLYNKSLQQYLNNPVGGGLYVSKVYSGMLLDKAGIKPGDVIYEINGYPLDEYGDIHIGWNIEKKISSANYINRLGLNDTIEVILYRNGERKEVTIMLETNVQEAIHKTYNEFEKVDYEIIGGMVIAPLNMNIIEALFENFRHGGLSPIATSIIPALWLHHLRQKPSLIITHVFPHSPAQKAPLAHTALIQKGALIDEVNGIPVSTLEELRTAIKTTNNGYLTIKTQHDSQFIALSLKDIMEAESRLSATYGYRISPLVESLGSVEI